MMLPLVATLYLKLLAIIASKTTATNLSLSKLRVSIRFATRQVKLLFVVQYRKSRSKN